MFSTFLFTFIIGFYLWYSASSKMKVRSNFGTEHWSRKNPSLSKLTGILAFVLGIYFSIELFGLMAGIFYSIILLMTVASFTILLLPLTRLNTLTMGSFILGIITLELIF